MENETRVKRLEEEIEKIKARNEKVERDKRWETSLFRAVSVGLLTYSVMVVFMLSISIEKPFINAIIPTLGFLLSTFSLPFLKNFWIRKQK